MNKIQQQCFGTEASGQSINRYVLSDGVISVGILNLGGTIQFLKVPGRNREDVDIALGFDTQESYYAQDKYIGALIGRCANRIAQGRFSLNGKEYHLECNNGRNHLHGWRGFDKKIWQAEIRGEKLLLKLFSEDGDAGYPGSLKAEVSYTVKNRALIIDYRACSNMDTLCNLTNHVYWNLAGHGSGTVAKQEITIYADEFTPCDKESIPTGILQKVDGTPFDLRTPTPMGKYWDDTDEQLTNAGGYDHNFVVRGKHGTLRKAASVCSLEAGIYMSVETTMPGIQFYTGNYLNGEPVGKNGALYGRRCGFCLETQYYPDAINRPQWPQPLLKTGETWSHQTIYRFETE